ncbi:MAG: tRNA pseudouridine(38-40) synthase TruA [Saprospiraceae bacterium]|nr:tRNA pseudouridine(38-40) synthase TruA [Saprospiraceae bacterium]
MRYFVELSYNGTRYHGWQKQPNARTIQNEIENVFSVLLKQPIEVIGCGRTDTGVHAAQYYLHFDTDRLVPDEFLYKANAILSNDIFLKRIFQVPTELHARFSALKRAYRFFISNHKSPFHQETYWHYHSSSFLELSKMQECANLLLDYKEFKPFCKSNSGVDNYFCTLSKSQWIETDEGFVYEVEASRFLRGMVRIIVGTCISYSTGKLSLDELTIALNEQTQLPVAWSVPPQGLFLTKVEYNF